MALRGPPYASLRQTVDWFLGILRLYGFPADCGGGVLRQRILDENGGCASFPEDLATISLVERFLRGSPPGESAS